MRVGEGVVDADQRRAITAMARRHGWALVVLFGSSARGERGRDMDLVIMPEGVPDLMRQGGWLAELEALFAPRPVDLLLLTAQTSPVARFEAFREGRCLYERQPGLFSAEQDRAFFLFADSEKFRRAAREMLHG